MEDLVCAAAEWIIESVDPLKLLNLYLRVMSVQ
jgi:hypothetical protein